MNFMSLLFATIAYIYATGYDATCTSSPKHKNWAGLQ